MDITETTDPTAPNQGNAPAVPSPNTNSTRNRAEFESDPHSVEQLEQLSRTLLKSTGLAPKQKSVEIFASILCWGLAALGGACGILLSGILPAQYQSLDSFLWDRDVTQGIFGVAMAVGFFMPLGIGFTMTGAFDKWYRGLRTREVLLSIILVPDIGRIIAHGLFRVWRRTFLFYILPFFFLGFGTACYATAELMEHRSTIRFEALAPLLPVAIVAMMVLSPLIMGAPSGVRWCVHIGKLGPILSPFWIPFLGRIMDSFQSPTQGLVFAGIFITFHLMVIVPLILHLRNAPQNWYGRLMESAERA